MIIKIGACLVVSVVSLLLGYWAFSTPNAPLEQNDPVFETVKLSTLSHSDQVSAEIFMSHGFDAEILPSGTITLVSKESKIHGKRIVQ